MQQSVFTGGQMLVKFTSSTSGQMIMFADNARELLHVMGKTCFAQGVFEKESLQEALEKLRHAAHEGKRLPASHDEDKEPEKDEVNELPVNISQRAQPLIRLMEKTWKAGGFIVWEAPQPFDQ